MIKWYLSRVSRYTDSIRIPSRRPMDIEPKKTSRLKKCPPRLKSLLEALRMVPPEPRLMPFDEALGLISIQFPGKLSFIQEEIALELCLRMLKQSAGPLIEFGDYVWQPRYSRHQDRVKAVQDAVDRYESFRIAREKVAGLAKLSQFHVDKRRRMRQLLRSLDIEIDEQGEVQTREDWFRKAVDGVEAARIRECGYCQRIFWAGRPAVQGCSPRCLDILRKRKKRQLDAAKLEGDKQGAPRSPLDETEKRELVRQVLRSGGLDQLQIAKQTRLSIDQVGDVLTYLLLESREVHSQEKDETRVYFLKETQQKT